MSQCFIHLTACLELENNRRISFWSSYLMREPMNMMIPCKVKRIQSKHLLKVNIRYHLMS